LLDSVGWMSHLHVHDGLGEFIAVCSAGLTNLVGGELRGSGMGKSFLDGAIMRDSPEFGLNVSTGDLRHVDMRQWTPIPSPPCSRQVRTEV
jgi:hypothetical protein